ncbi:MOSC domain-containing protein [Actinoplanes palleronii]|uniref:Molybdenum cofactor biosysynthesis protein n=1 Tax=Actinoplanes palleronii TaxID=113570 RepID=A0ABQ4B6N1_9ACTN|nr:MOSC N-terminal beta barrel domain-containing protein [Actinoplanes palleronii]GIE66314.1 molybdenum cofactor biosysynthesis protein [Actinoplanes palleronii]
MRIAALHTYPVKGCHRLDHDEAGVEPWGLTGDRRWMMVDAGGVGVTQRDTPLLTQLTVRPRPGGLRLSAPGLPELDLDEPAGGPKVAVRVFRNKPEVPARHADAGSAWCSEFLGRDVRLAWQADPTGRTIPEAAQPGDRVSLADGYPVLLANTASLDAVNGWLVEAGDEPVPMHRFRPNLVVDGAPAWAEDGWLGRRLRIGEVTFRVSKACPRCRVTTIDQETGETGRQPLTVLGQHRRIDGGLMFAVNLVPELSAGDTGVLRVGDSVVPQE